MNNYDTLLSALDKGLYLDNSLEMIKICQDLSNQNTQYAWVFFIFNTLFDDIIYNLEDRPVKVSEVDYLEKNISPHIKAIIGHLIARDSISQIADQVNILVLNFPNYLTNLHNI